MSDFVNRFATRLASKVDEGTLALVIKELQVFSADYTIEETCKDLVPADYVPQTLKNFLVTRKIEGLSPKSIKNYSYCLMDFVQAVKKDLSMVCANDVRLYLYNYQERRKISNKSLDNKLTIIKTFFAWAAAEEEIPKNPCVNIKPIKCEIRQRKPLTARELEKVREACKTAKQRAIIETLYSTGCRVSEIVKVNVSDINFASGELSVIGKGNKERTVYLSAKALIAIEEYVAERSDKDPALFTTDKLGKRASTRTIQMLVADIGKASNLGRRLYPHLLRHTTATMALNRGMDITVVQKLLGHEKLDTTMIYAKVDDNQVKTEHSKFIA